VGLALVDGEKGVEGELEATGGTAVGSRNGGRSSSAKAAYGSS